MSFPSTTTCSHTWFGTGRGCKSPGVLSCRVLLRPPFLQFRTYVLISLLRPYHQYSRLISSMVLFCPGCANNGSSCASRIRAVLRKILPSAVVSGTTRHPSRYPAPELRFLRVSSQLGRLLEECRHLGLRTGQKSNEWRRS